MSFGTRGNASIREIQEAFPEKGRTGLYNDPDDGLQDGGQGRCEAGQKGGQLPDLFPTALSRESAQRRLIDDLLGLFGGRAQPVMAHLVESGKLSLEEVRKRNGLYAGCQRKRNNMIPMQWTAGIFNHLWQSTMFAAATWLLALALRKNDAPPVTGCGCSLR